MEMGVIPPVFGIWPRSSFNTTPAKNEMIIDIIFSLERKWDPVSRVQIGLGVEGLVRATPSIHPLVGR